MIDGVLGFERFLWSHICKASSYTWRIQCLAVVEQVLLAVCLCEVVRFASISSKATHPLRSTDLIVLVTLCSHVVNLQCLMQLIIAALIILTPLVLQRVLLWRNQDPVVYYGVSALLWLWLQMRGGMSGTNSGR